MHLFEHYYNMICIYKNQHFPLYIDGYFIPLSMLNIPHIYDTSHLIISIPMANILNCGIVSSNYSIYMISICIYTYTYLVGGLEHEFYFAIYWEVHNQLTNSIIFQRGRLNHQPDMYQKPQFSIYISIFFFKT